MVPLAGYSSPSAPTRWIAKAVMGTMNAVAFASMRDVDGGRGGVWWGEWCHLCIHTTITIPTAARAPRAALSFTGPRGEERRAG